LHAVASGSGGELSRLAIYFSERNRLVLSREMLSTGTRRMFLFYKTVILLILTLKFFFIGKPELVPWIWKGFIHGLREDMKNDEVIGKLV